MTAKNRATQIGKLHTALKKHFKPAPPSPGRPLMEHVLYASLLEDTPADLADEGFAKCEQEFFDWNEVRVTTVTELAEVLSSLPSAITSAIRLKKNLQSMFETFYNFDLDYLKKENLGKAVAKFEAMSGMTPFVLSYLIQHGLGGHAIPIDKSAMQIMWLSGAVSESESESGKVPGLERTIAKNKAIEFSSLLHQAGVAFQANPKDKTVWEVLLSVNKDAKALYEQPATDSSTKSPSKSGETSSDSESTSATSKGSKSVTAKPPAIESAEKKAAKASEAAIKSAESRKAKDKALSSPPKPSPPAPPKPTSTKASATAKASGKPSEKSTSASKVSEKATKPAKAAPKTLESKPAESKAVKGKDSGDKAAAEKSSSAKSPSTKSPSAKTPSAKASTTQPPSSKSSETDTKSAEVKPTSKKASKPAAKTPEEPETKPTSKKSAQGKPLSSKSPVEKPLSKKAETKPASKKVSDPKAAGPAKDASSTNKKLTKQKPR